MPAVADVIPEASPSTHQDPSAPSPHCPAGIRIRPGPISQLLLQSDLLSLLPHLRAASAGLHPRVGQAPAGEQPPARTQPAGLERILPAAASLRIHTRADADGEVLGCCGWRRRSRWRRQVCWAEGVARAGGRGTARGCVPPACHPHRGPQDAPRPYRLCFFFFQES